MGIHVDLTDQKTNEYQHQMMLALRRTDLGEFIKSELPTIVLDPAFCQLEARKRRTEAHIEATRLLARRAADEVVSFATWVPREVVSKEPLPQGPKHLVERFASATRSTEINAIAGATELDFLTDRRIWQGTVHAIVSHPRHVPRPYLSATLQAALGGSERTSEGAYRPLVLKPVTDLPGLIPYVFKQLSVIKTTQRSPWIDDKGRPRTSKQRLRTAQLRQLLLQTQRDGVPGRVLITSNGRAAR